MAAVNGRIVVDDAELREFGERVRELAKTERMFSRLSAEAMRQLAPHMAIYAEARVAVEDKLGELAEKYEVPDGQSWELVPAEGGFVRRIDQEHVAPPPRAERRQAARRKLKAEL